jgi:Mitochondrial degradasome RNA helicase subunit C terminal
LSFRFAGIFNSQALASHVTDLVEAKIALALSGLDFDPLARRETEKDERLWREIQSHSPLAAKNAAFPEEAPLLAIDSVSS